MLFASSLRVMPGSRRFYTLNHGTKSISMGQDIVMLYKLLLAAFLYVPYISKIMYITALRQARGFLYLNLVLESLYAAVKY